MSESETRLEGPDFASGVPVAAIADGAMLLGHVGGEAVLVARRGEELFAIGGVCTHYGAPLSEGLLAGDTVRCPWHHACFSLRSGEALRAPALSAVACWQVEQRDGNVYVRGKVQTPPKHAPSPGPQSIVIVGGGAAGNAAAEMLRREGYSGRITMLSADDSLPCDRPSLSKGYLAGTVTAQSISLRSADFYEQHGIDVKTGARAASIDTSAREVKLTDGSRYRYDTLLLATGAEPVPLEVPGAELPHVHYLRTQADGSALVARARSSHQAVVIGASFIGMEVAASLRARDVEVHVVGREMCPMEQVLGPEVGSFLRGLHEEHGVTFHFRTTPTSIDARGVTLQDGARLEADLVVVGVGVRPAISLAAGAGIATDRGVTVDEYLETSIRGIFAAGDIARWPDPLTGQRIRVEHWVVAERQGQTAARNMLRRRERFDAVPFFWTEQYDFALGYVGHAEQWDNAEIDGQLDARDCTITYRKAGRILSVATIGRDLASLQAEADLEQTIARLRRQQAA